MQLAILHLSDLHRDPSNPISNASLLDSLERDRARYTKETPRIPEPDLVIVSGDLVYGVPKTSADPDGELSRQYEQAENFLASLCNTFVQGDRRRVVLVPGNHDVSLPRTMRSMKRLDPDPASVKEILAEWVSRLAVPNSSVRWSWEELCFYEVTDTALYLTRLEAFSQLYERFYAGTQKYDLEPERQFDIFDYPQYSVTVSAFNSCCNNDPLNRQGVIHPDCIAAAAHELRQSKYANRMRMAVWHHNTSGPPLRSDYLDSGVLQVLIDSGFSIGFHGHQHKAQFIDEKFQFGSDRKITIVSAGTLCAGPKALPPGHARAYNLLEVDLEANRARLHLRTMQNESFEQPIWGPGQFASSLRSYVEFGLQPPPPPPPAATVEVAKAEALIRKRAFEDAIAVLKPLATPGTIARRLLLDCYVAKDRTKDLCEDFYPPESDNEIVYVADALWSEKRRDRLVQLLSLEIVRKSTNPAVRDVLRKYTERLK